ncbi:MAG TPA: histidine kinase, partial [Rugosimonospora sp.]|nr:histidine kinase [Rugosimonospora sp.]
MSVRLDAVWYLKLRESPWWYTGRTIVIMVAIGAGVVTSRPVPSWHGAGLATAVCLPPVAAGWVSWGWQRARGRPTTVPIMLALVAGLALSIVHPRGSAIAFVAVPCLWAGIKLPWYRSLPLVLAASAVFPVAGFLNGFGWWIVAGPVSFLAALMGGLLRRQSEALAEEARLMREEQARSAALAERARIAREIHDVLAHSLAALSVQLETADALLENGRAEQARRSVVVARQLAREGLAETRRAIGALRGDTLALPELLDALATGYRNDFAAPAAVRVEGRPGELSPDTSLALYRSAQEAM